MRANDFFCVDMNKNFNCVHFCDAIVNVKLARCDKLNLNLVGMSQNLLKI